MQDLFEQALNKARKGLTVDEAVLTVPKEQQAELKALLEISLLLSNIPKAEAPKPALRRKYALAPVTEKFWLSVFHISRFAAGSAAIVLLLGIFSIGGYKALQSLPGQTLFPVKRTAENVRLKFVISQSSKAQLELQFAENRLNEAKTVLGNPQSTKQQEIAALNELKTQTQTAAKSVQQAAYNQPLNSTSQPLVSKLQSLAREQTALIKITKSDDAEVRLAAGGAAEASQTATDQAGQIKKYLTIAESSQDPVALVDLSEDPDTVSVTGFVQRIGLFSITVEKTVFQLTDKSEIKNVSGQKLNFEDLKTGYKIKISGKKETSAIITQSILLLSKGEEEQAEIKGAATSTPAGTSTQETVTSRSSLESLLDQPEAKPRLGNIIIEDPNPKYNP